MTDIFGLTLNRQELPLSAEDIEALQASGVAVPDPAVIVFEWREASACEREKYAAAQRAGWQQAGKVKRSRVSGWLTC